MFSDGSFLTRQRMSTFLSSILQETDLNIHSFRIGGATALAVAELDIQMLSYRLLVDGPVIVLRDTFACRPRFYVVTLPLCAPRTLMLPVGTRLNSILHCFYLQWH